MPRKNIYDPPQYSPRNIAKFPYNLFQNRINFRPARTHFPLHNLCRPMVHPSNHANVHVVTQNSPMTF